MKIWWFLAITWMILILYFTLIPQPAVEGDSFLIPHQDKVLHFGVFFILSFLLLQASTSSNFYRAYFFALLITLLYGGITEMVQLAVPGRVFDFKDLFANCVGASVIYINKFIKK